MGEFEIAKAVANLKFLQEKLKLKSPVHQVHTVVNRMFGDLEFRGSVKPNYGGVQSGWKPRKAGRYERGVL